MALQPDAGPEGDEPARRIRATVISRAVYARQLRKAIDRREDRPPAAPERPAQAV